MDELATLIEQLLTAETDEQRAAVLAQIEDLNETATALNDAAQAILATGDKSPEAMETLASIADALDLVRAAATKADDERSALAARFDAPEPADVTAAKADDKKADKAKADGEEDATDDKAEGTETATDDKVEAATDEPEVEVEAAPAPRTPPKPSLAILNGLQPEDSKPTDEVATVPAVKVTAAMDVPGLPVGTPVLNARAIADAIIARQEVLGKVRGSSVAMENVPVIHFDYLDGLKMASEDKMMNGLLLREAAEPEALTAAGGFCAPNETVYDFVKISSPSDLVQDFLPTVGAKRGSIEYPDSPDIRDAFTENVSRAYSNADDIAGVHKITAVIDCPSFNLCTVGAQYVILQFGNFATRAYPEWVAHWVALSMDAHAHLVSQKLILQMVALSNAVVNVGPNAGATSTLISNLSLAAADFRQDLRMGREAQLEVMLPSWTPELIRSDLARASKGMLETLQVPDSLIASWFAARNLTPRYVADWQNVSANSATGASVWPSGLSFLIYPPGTFVKLDMGTLDLGVVRDSTLNETNDYNIFIETFESVCKPGIESRLYTVAVCANGAFSADQNLSCAGLDIPGS